MATIHELLVPDIGDFHEVPVVELLVHQGDRLLPDTSVVTLESDKASMEVPAEVDGTVVEILVKEGDRVSEGTLLLRYRVETGETAEPVALAESAPRGIPREEQLPVGKLPVAKSAQDQGPEEVAVAVSAASGPAAPSVRRLARELGVSLAVVPGSGPKGRLRKEDVRAYVKQVIARAAMSPAAVAEPAEAEIDFSLYGPVEALPLSRIQKKSGAQLARNWAKIPHVSSFEEADITELEAFRQQLNSEQAVRLTLLPFLLKAVQHCLQIFPQLNSSLQGETLVVKRYFHLGFAVDTPAGLLVPVIRDVDQKGVVQIAAEMQELTERAKKGRLKMEQMQGGTFTISSIGGVGTTHFTPIINAPEVAILGVGRGAMRPVWDGGQFVPRRVLPLSLSWDHRAMDGVVAARFATTLSRVLADFRRVVL